MARAPKPPAMTGLPLPSLVWLSLALRFRVTAIGAGGSEESGKGSLFSVGVGATVVSSV